MVEPARSIDGVIYEDFGGELRKFVVKVPELAAIQAETNVGPAVIVGELARAIEVTRLADEQGLTALQTMALGLGAWRVEYITRPIFHGLVKGGTAPNDAARLVRKWIEERGFAGLLENVRLAFRLVTGGTNGPEDDPVGEGPGAAARTTAAPPSQTARSASPSSTSAPARSAGAPPTSPKPRSGSSSRRRKAGAKPTRRRTKTAAT